MTNLQLGSPGEVDDFPYDHSLCSMSDPDGNPAIMSGIIYWFRSALPSGHCRPSVPPSASMLHPLVPNNLSRLWSSLD